MQHNWSPYTSDIFSIIMTIAPVVCSNQAMLWDWLHQAGIDDQISGYWRLLNHH